MNKVTAILLLFCVHTLFSTVVKGPYLLYEGDNSNMTILWQLSEPLESAVSWGLTKEMTMGSAVGSAVGTDTQYAYTIHGLEPGTLYHYEVTGVGAGTFRTAPSNDTTNITLFAYGDTRSNPTKHNAVCQTMVDRVNSDSTLHTAVLFSGDYVSQGGSEEDWNEQFFAPMSGIKKLQANLPIVGAIGNHEGERPGGAEVLKKYYPFPHETAEGFYWACDYGPVRIIFVDQFTTSYAPGSAQYNWIKSELASVTKEWVVMVLHSPGYSAGGGHSNDMNVQNYLQPLCEEFGVDMVITGDNHYYARAEVNGVQHITTGGGGAPLYTPDPTYPHIVKTDKSYHFCEFAFAEKQCQVSVRRAGGALIESFTLTHEGTKTPSVVLQTPNTDTSIALDEELEIVAEVQAWGEEVTSLTLLINETAVEKSTEKPYSFIFASDTPDTVTIAVEALIQDVIYTSDPVTVAVVDPAEHEFTIEKSVERSSDDAEEYLADGVVDLNSSDLEFMDDSKFGEQIVGIRFTDIALPEDAVVTGAWIQFTADETGSGTINCRIEGEHTASSKSFSEVANNISERVRTEESLLWTPENWPTADVATAVQRTPDLSAIVDEVRQIDGWDGTLTFIISADDGTSAKRTAESFDGGRALSPRLIVRYKRDQKTAITSSKLSDNMMSVSVVPNPFEQGETCRFLLQDEILTRGQNCELLVLTALGVPVYYRFFPLPHGGEPLIWNGKNRNGAFVSSGTYLALITVHKDDGTKAVYRQTVGVKQ